MAIGSGTNAGSLDLGQARKLATAFGNGRAWFGPGAPWLLKAGLPGPEWFIITPKDEVMKNLKRIALVATATAAAALAPMVTTASADAASVLMVRGTQVWPVYSPGTAEWDSQQDPASVGGRSASGR